MEKNMATIYPSTYDLELIKKHSESEYKIIKERKMNFQEQKEKLQI